jgi:hypothetical protein
MENELPEIEEARDQEATAPEPAEKHGSSLPLVLMIVSLLIWFAFQTVQLVIERNNLGTLKTNLEAPMQESQKLQTQLQSLISKTAELANQGNGGAKAVVDELEKRGIPIRGAPPPAQPAK